MNTRTIMCLEDVPVELPEVRATVEAAITRLQAEPHRSCEHLFDHRGITILCLAHPAVGAMCATCATAHDNQHVSRCTICSDEITGEIHAFGVSATVEDALLYDRAEGTGLSPVQYRRRRSNLRVVDEAATFLLFAIFSVMLCGRCVDLVPTRRGFRDVTP